MKDLSLEDFEVAIRSFMPLIIEFWSPLCTVCDKAEVYLEKLQNAYKNRISVAKINIDNANELILKYSIDKLPTFILFKCSDRLLNVPTTSAAQNLPLDCVGIKPDSERGKLSGVTQTLYAIILQPFIGARYE